MTARYLFIDFDGVINALNPRFAREEWGEVETTKLRGFSITYAPEVVRAIEALAADGVHVVWLTTWCEHTAEFGPLGFTAHPYIGSEARVGYRGSGWWKWQALREHVETLPADAVIAWCNDDLDFSVREQPEIGEFIQERGVLAISPHDWPGLTRDQIAALFTHFSVPQAVTR